MRQSPTPRQTGRPAGRLTRRALLAGAPAALLAGCATRFIDDAQPDAAPRLQVRQPSLHPLNGGVAVDAAALAPGDILLSSAAGWSSVGIRLATLSAVSHASLYLGAEEAGRAGTVAEAVPQGIRRRSLEALVAEESTVVAFRHPEVQAEHLARMHAFVAENVGKAYSFTGIVLQAPFTLDRKLCELPLTPTLVRDICLQGLGAIHLGLGPSDRFFCSQFVLEAYRRAGLPLTDADPRLLSPADLLHMREGDVPSVRTRQALRYVGHLKADVT